MADNKQSNQSRFILAAVLSLAVFLSWSYFFPPKKSNLTNTNTATDSAQNVANATPTPETVQNQPTPTNPISSTPDNTPNKSILIKTPLYQVKLDSKGALATSWVLLKNKSYKGEKPLFADNYSKDGEQKPLELISPEALSRSPREIPFRLATGDANVDALINERNYTVSINDETIELGDGQSKQIDYVLRDEANNLEVTKTFVFNADSYVTDLKIKLTRNNQPVQNTKLLIGASIGDHGINNHNTYHIEPEAVAFVNGGTERHSAVSLIPSEKDSGSLAVNGNIDWAGVGDAYFAMAAIPAQQTSGLEYRSSKYEIETKPFYYSIFSWITRTATTKETRHLLTAYVPIAADGSTTKIYTGTKDYFVLNEYNRILTDSVGRTIDLEDFINFSNWSAFRWTFKHLAIPILYALTFLNTLFGSYGLAIIIFTFFFYSLLFPMRWYQSKSFKKASGNAPKMKDLQERLKDMQKKGIPADDPRMRELQMEQLRMTKDALPVGGCLPMVLQFPLLIALYTAVTIAIGFRQASFLWLPDLSAGDPFHLLEFGFAFSMILSMKFTPQAATVTPEQQMQQKMMTYLMPVMMLWIMWSAPAGLLLYWFFGNIVSFGQQVIINRMNKTGAPPKEEIVESIPKNAKKVKPNLSTS